ncbi:MAG: xanthine dehydrogenase family protein molybdopterin-binding subunit, partial [Alphaproteobacteria bacterium]|nr:xanthine dehydrogenase family protein molybdopterin-binding subunit [Alphaproteobacteria bacterium]
KRRLEDQRFITGTGRYLDDVSLPDQTYAYILRSPHAHARIRGIDTAAAARAPGVRAVLTGRDYQAAKLGPLKSPIPVRNRSGADRADPPRWPLAHERVRHVGDGVALVVADTLAQARDAAELVAVDYQDLPIVAHAIEAMAAGAPQLFDEAPNNVCIDWETGDAAAVAAAFAQAAHIAKIDIINNRVSANSMEMRGAIGVFADGRYLLYASTQGANATRDILCKQVFGIPAEQMRVVTPDVGGGFGMKVFSYPEYPLVLWAARLVERPVRWIPDRSESLLSDSHGRDNITHAEIALDRDARVIAMRVDLVVNFGAYVSQFAPFLPTGVQTPLFTGSYMIPAIYVTVKAAFTNTVPVDAYRGAGRPEASYVIERLMDSAARELGLPRDEIRRRNFIPPARMPYKTPLVHTYDSGEFARNLSDAQNLADWPGFSERRRQSQGRGRLRGIGLATYIEASGAIPEDRATLRVEADGTVVVLSGSQSIGQGQETTFVQFVEQELGIPLERVRFVQGDSDVIALGTGSGGSRSMIFGGVAVIEATKSLISNAKSAAADLLEAATVDVEYRAGQFQVAGTDRRVGLFDVARRAAANGGELQGEGRFAPQMGRSFPNGCHVCEVEVDPETGVVEVVRYSIVDDFGRLANPMLVRGQVHGGTVQGIGQALYEHCVYDAGSGQLLSGSFMDYAMPRADVAPPIAFGFNEVPCRNNPIGAKGCGEAGCAGSLPAVISALTDALSEFGIGHIDMPATSERVWRAINEKRAG